MNPRTVYDEVREDAARLASHYADNGPASWRDRRGFFESGVFEERMKASPSAAAERKHLVHIAALAIAQIEALDRRASEGAK